MVICKNVKLTWFQNNFVFDLIYFCTNLNVKEQMHLQWQHKIWCQQRDNYLSSMVWLLSPIKTKIKILKALIP